MKKLTISQKSGGKDKRPPPPEQDPTQRHHKHCVATSLASPASESACGFLICRRSKSFTEDLSFTIDVDVWRAATLCHPTRSRGKPRVQWHQERHNHDPPVASHCHKPPIQICPTRGESGGVDTLGCMSMTNAAPPTTLLRTAVCLAFTSTTSLAINGRPNANPRRTDKIKLDVKRQRRLEQPTEENGGPELGGLEPAANGSPPPSP
jgi:hypothetical protein